MEFTIWRPFAGLESFGSQFSQLFDQTRGRSVRSASSASTVWYPAVDVLESKDSYLLRAELPGMNREDFNLEVKNGMLTISGERKLEELISGVNTAVLSAFRESSHARSICPQTVQQDGIQATYRDGILEIYVPKLDLAKARQITVN